MLLICDGLFWLDTKQYWEKYFKSVFFMEKSTYKMCLHYTDMT